MTELLFLSWQHLSRVERACLIALFATLAAWIALPPITQDQAYHAFADQRTFLGVSRAMDVLSNAAFALVALYGIARLVSRRRAKLSSATEAGLWCVALGFALTAAGSAWYHLAPNDATLVWDRLPMTLVFSGILAAALAQRAGANVARVALALLFELGVASVALWAVTGDLSLYVTLQFGGIAALVLLLATTRRGDDAFPWGWVIGWYVLAKVVEYADVAIWEASGGVIAGHALKHLAAAAAGIALFRPLRPAASPASRRSPG